MENTKRVRTLPALALRISAALLAIWLLCMTAVTIIVAQYIYTDLVHKSNDYVYGFYNWRGRIAENIKWYLSEDAPPGRMEYDMLSDMGFQVNYLSVQDGNFPSLLRNRYVGKHSKVAIAYYRPGGKMIYSGNYLYFSYSYEHNWREKTDGYAYIDMERWGITSDSTEWLKHDVVMKFTGYFEGAEFIPYTAEYDAKGNGGSSIVGREWVQFYQAEECAEECVTVYTNYAEIRFYDEGDEVKYRGGYFESLRDLVITTTENKDYYSEGGVFGDSEYSLRRILIFGEQKFRNAIEGVDYGDRGAPVVLYCTAAVVAYPLRIAVDELWLVYASTFASCVIFVLLVLRSIRKNLTVPIKLVCKGINDGWGYVYVGLNDKPIWHEPHEIGLHYREVQDKLQEDKNEITRLTAALEYAREAEEQRQQLSSNIAHELKTPLAVIRSYAEGLQEHIAEEKRDKYLEVIVGETERMDEMVLEMLELSRLEAGRVKLARDVCDLSALVRGVFEKLEPAAAAKDLTVNYELRESCLMSADEARLLQVIENFASNALRYTPMGGQIWVRTKYARGYATFAVENTSPPLSEEVLANVWERFWRAEESRSEKSSGLGLAIAKSIVELHSGKCTARNTENGVEFSFTI